MQHVHTTVPKNAYVGYEKLMRTHFDICLDNYFGWYCKNSNTMKVLLCREPISGCLWVVVSTNLNFQQNIITVIQLKTWKDMKTFSVSGMRFFFYT